MFVIQQRFKDYEKWSTLSTRYPTIEEARAALKKKSIFPAYYRIAEEYTVTRYKAVK